jgi:uncharacterized MnhB-related membrane protein
MAEKIFLILLIILAIISLNTTKLRRAVIYLGLFSLAGSFTYLLYGAPDVAIAEAVIGSGIATVLYLVAIKRYQVFTIYFLHNGDYEYCDPLIKREHSRLIKGIENLIAGKELEPHTISTMEDSRYILSHKEYDLLVEPGKDEVCIYGFSEDYHLDDIEKLTTGKKYKNLNIIVIRCGEEVIPNAQMD